MDYETGQKIKLPKESADAITEFIETREALEKSAFYSVAAKLGFGHEELKAGYKIRMNNDEDIIEAILDEEPDVVAASLLYEEVAAELGRLELSSKYNAVVVMVTELSIRNLRHYWWKLDPETMEVEIKGRREEETLNLSDVQNSGGIQ